MYHRHIYSVVSVVSSNGDKITTEDKVAPINNFLYSIYSDVIVALNNKILSTPNHLFPFRMYLENLINYGNTAKESHQTMNLFYKDTPGKMNDLTGLNAGFASRCKFIAKSKSLPMLGRLSIDITAQNKYLINGVSMNVLLSRASSDFALMHGGDEKYDIKIQAASLFCRRVKISPDVLIAHNKVLATTPARYPINRVDIKHFTLPSGVSTPSIDALFTGQLPIRVVVGFIKNEALNGNSKLNPFNFEHFNLNYLSLNLDGVPVNGRAFTPSFSDENPNCLLSYFSTFAGTGIFTSDDGWGINRDDYSQGYMLHVWDLTSDNSANVHQWSLRRNGVLGLDMRFAKALEQSVSVIVYGEFQNLVQIDFNRTVYTDF
jgi:hypothetical protein